MRRFGVEASDFFFLVEKLHCAVQQHMHIDSLVGVAAIGIGFGDLKERAFKGDGRVLSHGALLFKAQGFFDLGGVGFSPGGLRLGGRLGEFVLMLGEMPLEHDLRLGLVFGPRSSEFTDQPVLESSPQPLDSGLGLRGACRDQGHPELFQPSSHLGGRTLVL